MLRLMGLCALLLLAACGDTQRAKDIVAADFRDPDSVQWRNVHSVTDAIQGNFVCGEVNARNGFGAYVGYRKFVVDMDKGTAVIEPQSSSFDDEATAGLQNAVFGLASTACKF